MNESLIFGIIIGGVVASIFWFFTKRKSGTIDNTVILEKEKENEILKKEIEGRKTIEEDLRKSLTKEQELVKEQLKTINKVDEHKTAISKYTTETALKNKTDAENIDFLKNWAEKLTGSNRYQGNIGEKILKGVLNSCEYREGRDFTCQQGDKIINTDNELKTIKPDTYLKMTNDTDLVIDSKVSKSIFLCLA